MTENEEQGLGQWVVTFRLRSTGATLRSPLGPYPLPIAERIAQSERSRAMETTMIQIEQAQPSNYW